ncbi:MAG: outer membrane lipoprotein carrier protein LolA [Gemmatimonadaceae bacterium]|nr:outer membrane lipoprotein carrier protein LolA [Gemmatimonadaceae bacterium]
MRAARWARLGAQAVAIAWLLAPTAAAAQTKADSVLDRAVQLHGKVGTLRATFVQTLTNPLTGAKVTSRGELQQKPPRYLSVVFTEPRGDRIVADGQSLWVQLPSAMPDQILRLPLGAAGPGLGGVDLLGQFFENPRAKYTVSSIGAARVDGRATYALSLTPKDGEGLFEKATIWLDDATGYLRQFETTDANGVVRSIRLVRFRPGARLDDGVFRFVPPKGARILERPGM